MDTKPKESLAYFKGKRSSSALASPCENNKIYNNASHTERVLLDPQPSHKPEEMTQQPALINGFTLQKEESLGNEKLLEKLAQTKDSEFCSQYGRQIAETAQLGPRRALVSYDNREQVQGTRRSLDELQASIQQSDVVLSNMRESRRAQGMAEHSRSSDFVNMINSSTHQRSRVNSKAVVEINRNSSVANSSFLKPSMVDSKTQTYPGDLP